MKRTLKRLLALVLVFCMSTVVFGYSVDAIMGDKKPLKDLIDAKNGFDSVDSKRSIEEFHNEYDCVAKNKWVDYYTIEFGNYPQDGISDMAKEPIKWLILEKVDGMALLMSLDILDCKPMFNLTKEENLSQDYVDENTWVYEKSDLRKWLNEDFYNKAFNSTEKEYIVQHDATSDKVSLPTVNEINSYFRLDRQDFQWNPDYSNIFDIKFKTGNPWFATKTTTYAKNSLSKMQTSMGYSEDSSYGETIWTRTFAGQSKAVVGGRKINTYKVGNGKKRHPISRSTGIRPCIWISFDPYVRSAKWQEWDSLGGKIASGLISGYLDTVLPGVGLLLP